MIQNVDYRLSEYTDERWAIDYDGIQFIIESIKFDEENGDDGAAALATINYTVISEKKPTCSTTFDVIVGDITSSILQDMVENKDTPENEE
jgi:hypothetical protein